MKEPIFDKKLSFNHKGCEGPHYFLGNPHTFPGRILAWCPVKKQSFCVSKSEISNCSVEAEYWLKGFLIGNQPAPPLSNDKNPELTEKEIKNWKRKLTRFENEGTWEQEE